MPLINTYGAASARGFGWNTGNFKNIIISSNATNYDLFVAAGSPTTAIDVWVTINPGVVISSSSIATNAFETGANWPAGSTITLVCNGLIIGKGGAGGAGQRDSEWSPGSGDPGADGGNALLVGWPTTISGSGTIVAGGGGGGGGGSGYRWDGVDTHHSSGGGGGGGGGNAGAGGTGGTTSVTGHPGAAGSVGTTIAGGLGGAGGPDDGFAASGGAGGNGGYGTAGASGVAGYGLNQHGQGGIGGQSGYSIKGYINVVSNSCSLIGPTDKPTTALRLRASATPYLARSTAPVSTGGTKFTFSFWIKPGIVLPTGNIMALTQTAGVSAGIGFADTTATYPGRLCFWQHNGSAYTMRKATEMYFKDPMAWYHICVIYDSTLATAEDRAQIWINGVRNTAWSVNTLPAQNLVSYFSSASAAPFAPALFGDNLDNTGTQNSFDGHAAQLNFIDGQTIAATGFGQWSATSGGWAPLAYAGTYGTNGFFLNFLDNSSATGLAKDQSGQGNNWTANNISIATGATYDASYDGPYVLSSGDPTQQGNYCVLNPLNAGSANACSNANLTSNATAVVGSFDVTQFNSYWEVSAQGSAVTAGVCNDMQAVTFASYTATVAASTTVGFRMSSAGTLQKCVAGSWTTVASGLTGPLFPYGVGAAADWNFGQRPYAASIPSGYKGVCTSNLPQPSVLNPSLHFTTSFYTGTLATQTIINTQVNGISWKPDSVWLAGTFGGSQYQFDSSRGVQKYIRWQFNYTEVTEATSLTSFNSNGFTIGDYEFINADPYYNRRYFAWQFKYNGGTTSSNTQGSVTSSVQVNSATGWSMARWTVPSSSSAVTYTVGHGLSSTPKWAWFKNLTVNSESWLYREDVGNDYAGLMDQYSNSSYEATPSTMWGSTNPTSSVMSFQGGSYLGPLAGQEVMGYFFSEIPGFSKMGTILGNSSADGPFVNLGFKPAFILYRRKGDNGAKPGPFGAWDAFRSPSNPLALLAYFPISNYQGVNAGLWSIEIFSSGFKLLNYDVGAFNGNQSEADNAGQWYDYMAFAQCPFKYATAR